MPGLDAAGLYAAGLYAAGTAKPTRGSAPLLTIFSSKPSDNPVACRSSGKVTVLQMSTLGSAAALVMPRKVMDRGCSNKACVSPTLLCLGAAAADFAHKEKAKGDPPSLQILLCRQEVRGTTQWSASAHSHGQNLHPL